MPFTAEWLEVEFGRTRTGIATVGYRLYKNDGTDSVARTAVGVVEVGGGAYGVPNVTIPDDAVGVEWDTGAPPLLYAHEDLEPLRLLVAGDYLIAATTAAAAACTTTEIRTGLTQANDFFNGMFVLVSNAAGFVTGQTIYVDGGMTAS